VAPTRVSTLSEWNRTARLCCHLYDRAKQALMLESDRPEPLREAIQGVAKVGPFQFPGFTGGLIDKFPIGAAFAKGLTLKLGQTHVHKYMRPLLDRIRRGDIDPPRLSSVIDTPSTMHRVPTADVPRQRR
jgi:threonine dehydrogenase-like Zn-dependent dehydrogenase